MGYDWTATGIERPIVGPDGAEDYAAEVLRAVGFLDALRTPTGPDEGLDVFGTGVVAQVKHQANQVGRPEVQRLVGAATSDAWRVFFALNGFSQPAVEFADAMGVALVIYSQMGHVAAASSAGHELLNMAGMSPAQRQAVANARLAEVADADIPERDMLMDRMEAVISRFYHAVGEITRLNDIARPTREEKRIRKRARTMALDHHTIGFRLEETFSPEPLHSDEPPGGSDVPSLEAFQLVVPPLDPDMASVRVVSGSTVLETVDVSGSGPSVAITPPTEGSTDGRVTLTWDGADADGDPLVYSVQYSRDNGATWTTLTIDASGTELAVPRVALPGSTEGRLRVIGSDGLRTAIADTDPFVMDNLAPEVFIDQPTDGAHYSGLQAIGLKATGIDPEDGRLGGPQLVWTSNLDGPIATGADAQIRADLLTEGVHTLTAQASDSAGLTSSARVTIQVSRLPSPPVNQDVQFGGFETPVSPDATNTENAGRTIPIKWTIVGEEEESSALAEAIFDMDGATYALKRSGGSYHLNVATPRSWAGTTRVFTVTLVDGREFSAVFSFQ